MIVMRKGSGDDSAAQRRTDSCTAGPSATPPPSVNNAFATCAGARARVHTQTHDTVCQGKDRCKSKDIKSTGALARAHGGPRRRHLSPPPRTRPASRPCRKAPCLGAHTAPTLSPRTTSRRAHTHARPHGLVGLPRRPRAGDGIGLAGPPALAAPPARQSARLDWDRLRRDTAASSNSGGGGVLPCARQHLRFARKRGTDGHRSGHKHL